MSNKPRHRTLPGRTARLDAYGGYDYSLPPPQIVRQPLPPTDGPWPAFPRPATEPSVPRQTRVAGPESPRKNKVVFRYRAPRKTAPGPAAHQRKEERA